LTCVPYDRPLLDAERRVFRRWLADGRIADAGQRHTAAHRGEARNGEARFLEESVHDVLAQADRGREAGATGIWNAEQLEHRDDRRLERGNAVDPLAHVEDDVELA